jgi:hypothetical protein
VTRRGRAPGVEKLEDRTVLTVGGGFTAAGILGEYFANTTLAGAPSFTRRDVRVDFDWGAGARPGGSTDPRYAQVGPDNFSVRWTGQFIPAFSETYTFTATTATGARLFVKPASAAAWTTVIDAWAPHAARDDAGQMALAAGTTYDVRLEYYDQSGPAVARLKWSGPSTPPEVIEPLGGVAANTYTDGFADAMKLAANEWTVPGGDAAVARDAQGWPTADAQVYVWQWGGDRQGTYRVQFNGQADVSEAFGTATFTSLGYDAASNTSTYQAVVTGQSADGPNQFLLVFQNTRRTPTSPLNSGVTNVRMMKPTSPGAAASYAAGSTFTDDLRTALGRFTALRFMAGTNFNDSVHWSDRTLPAYSTQLYFRPTESGSEGNGMAWEYRVMLANETGKDLYINVPEMADDDYVSKLAQLIKYGSDGVNPYTAPQANPVFPGLNPNLKVYVEQSNEVWNYSFPAWQQNFQAAQQAIANGTPDGKVITYDGNADQNIAWNRRHALRTVQVSNLFRSVYGDAAMGDRVRVLLEWQYDNAGFPPTAETQLNFLDDYFNNGDGIQHVTTPHPVSYYIWGGGGATYYDSSNSFGRTTLLAGGGFESPVVAGSQANPAGSGWTFAGTAGIAHNGSALGNPAAPEGSQVAYLQGAGGANGQFQTTVTVPANATSNVYALEFQAAQAAGSSMPLDVLVDGVRVSGTTWQQDSYTPGTDWETFSTRTFTAAPGSTHTVAFVGASTEGTHTLFVDAVKVTSVDALFAGEIPADTRNGDDAVTAANFQARTQTEVNWARAFGLTPVGYEGGWALGGDAGGTDLQNWAKFHDPRARAAQRTSLDVYYRAGGGVTTLGTYPLWAKPADAANEPIPQGIDDSNNAPRPAPTNGAALPATLTPAGSTLSRWADGVTLSADGWFTWNVLVPATGTYTFAADTAAGGTAWLTVDDVTLVASGASGAALSGSAVLTPGLHTVRLKAAAGSFGVNSVRVDRAQAAPPAAPGSVSAVAVSPSQVSLTWVDNSSDETGFQIDRATDAGFTQNLVGVTVGANTTRYDATGLAAGTTYYFRVRAVNAAGASDYAAGAAATTPAVGPGLFPISQDVGGPATAGSDGYDATADTYTLRGGGTGIGGTADQFHFVYRPTADDLTLVARVASLSAGNPGAEAGVMVRDGTGPGDRFAAVVVTPGGGAAFQWRSQPGTPARSLTADGVQAPAWVKLVRSGNRFTGYVSADGAAWSRVGTFLIVRMPAPVDAGQAVTAHDPAALATATFTGVAVQARVSLDAAFNQVGTTLDGAAAAGNLDGQGGSYSANLLGTLLTNQGVDFALGAYGANNVLRAAGRTLALPADRFRALALLGTGVNGSQAGTFTVTYADGSSATFTQTFSDWLAGPSAGGESVAKSMAYRNTPSGADPRAAYLYRYTFTLDPTKTVADITLPDNANINVLALTLLA